jgi:predicted ATPase
VPSSAGLPLRLTRLFGREPELVELEALVERTPLVTLVGAPGCGKTRLGVELAERLGSRFRDGVGFVDLAQVGEPAQVAGAAGLALGIREQPVTSMTDRLVRSVADAELLVLLDNCEHVAGGAADLTRALLASCPGVRVLATSRVALGLHGEQVWDVPPLDVPTAMALFADRAQLVSNGFGVDAAGEADVEAICRQLDGLPLAIELVAPWARVLSPAQIVHRLGGALPALSPGAGGPAPRQETMEPRSSGAIGSWTRRTSGCSIGCRSSWGASTLGLPRPSRVSAGRPTACSAA